MPNVIAKIVMVLAVVGFAISAYMTALFYRWIRPDTHIIPEFCRIKDSTCERIVGARYAAVFAIPNSLIGVVFYAAIIVAGAYQLSSGMWPLPWESFVVSIAAAIFSGYLAYALLWELKDSCVLCFISHGINLAITILLLMVGLSSRSV